MQPALILYDDDKDSFWAVAAEEEGATDAMVKYGVGVIEESGYIGEKITSAARVGETVPIESPVRASKSKGVMKNAIQIWQGQLRTVEHYVVVRLAKRIEQGSALFTWLFSVLHRHPQQVPCWKRWANSLRKDYISYL